MCSVRTIYANKKPKHSSGMHMNRLYDVGKFANGISWRRIGFFGELPSNIVCVCHR